MDAAWRLIWTAARRLRKAPVFSVTVVLTLALGIGATSAMLTVVRGVLLRPLPYPDPERLVGVWHTAPAMNSERFLLAHITYLFYRQQNQSLEDLGIYRAARASLSGGGHPEEVDAAEVTPSVLSILGVRPALGRLFVDAEERPGSEPTVVLSYSLWLSRFGGDPGVVGRSIRVDDVARTVVGVMPRHFGFPAAATRLWLPMTVDPVEPSRSVWDYRAIGRLRPGVTREAAQAELSALVQRLPTIHPDPRAMVRFIRDAAMAVMVHPLRDDVTRGVSRVLWMLLGAVALILLIANANVANLFLAHAEGRRQEAALRSALGAGPGALVGEHLAEGVLLAAVGGVAGLAAAAAAIKALPALPGIELPRLADVRIDGSVVLFTVMVSALSCVFFALAPGFRRTASPAVLLREGGRWASGGAGRKRMRHALVVVQLALAVILMTASMLLVRSFVKLRAVDPGCAIADVLTLRLPVSAAAYPGGQQTSNLYREVLERVRALPGVSAVGAGTGLPLGDGTNLLGHTFEDFPLDADEHVPNYQTLFALPGYFEALGIPLRAGRTFEWSDVADGAPHVVIVSESLARGLWPHESAVGKRLTPARATSSASWYTIVGVVGDVLFENPMTARRDAIYHPLAPIRLGSGEELFERSLSLIVGTNVPPETLSGSVTSAVWSVGPDLPVTQMRTMAEVARQANAHIALTMGLLTTAAGLALGLGVIGLYGVIAYVVAGRTREIGIRLAFGADGSKVRRMVVGEGLVMASIGLAVGLAGALAATRAMSSLLYSVSASDPWSYLGMAALLLAVAAAASYLPARRAAAMNPVDALRHEGG